MSDPTSRVSQAAKNAAWWREALREGTVDLARDFQWLLRDLETAGKDE